MKQQEKYTYADYLTWEEGRWEIIAGEIFDMTPAPSRIHQKILGELFFRLQSYVKDQDGRCEVYPAPFDVRFVNAEHEAGDDIDTVVQPDIVVVCDPEKLDDRGCLGAPDLVVEVLSPSTAKRDLKVKRQLYEQHGVKEYWLVHPVDQTVMVYILNNLDLYDKAEIYGREDDLHTVLFEGLKIELADVFSETIDKVKKQTNPLSPKMK